MKTAVTCLSALILILIAGVIYERNKTGELNKSVVGLERDRDALNEQLRKLAAQIDSLHSAQKVPAAASRVSSHSGAVGDNITAPPAPAVPEVPRERPGVTIKAPPGWTRNGAKAESYVVGVDAHQTWGGMPSAYVESLTRSVPGGFGGMMQTTSAESYVGKRVRLSGWIKSEDAAEGAQLWLRVDGQERGQVLQFDNMDNRAVKGTSDWQEASIVLDVPQGASALAYGFFVKGGGKMWVNGQRLEDVASDVPSTNMTRKPSGPPPVLPTAPRNLGFDPNPKS